MESCTTRFSQQIKDLFSRSTTVCDDGKMDEQTTLGEEAHRKFCDEQNTFRASALHKDTRRFDQSGTFLKPIRLSMQSTTAINHASRYIGGRSWRSPSPILHTRTSRALQQAQGLYTSIALCPTSQRPRSRFTDSLRLRSRTYVEGYSSEGASTSKEESSNTWKHTGSLSKGRLKAQMALISPMAKRAVHK